MLSHDIQLGRAAKFLNVAREALVAGRPDLVRKNLERGIGFMSQVHGELEREYLTGRGAVLPLTSKPVTLSEEQEQEHTQKIVELERSITEYGLRE